MLESTVTPIAGRAARVGCQSPDPLAALFLRSLRGAPSPFSTPPSPRYNRLRMDVFEELVRLRNLGQKCALATDRKSTRLNSSHLGRSYAVFCLKNRSKDDGGSGSRRYSRNREEGQEEAWAG